MKRLFIFALMTMAASSSFAISDTLNCINGPSRVITSRYVNDKDLHMMAQFMVDDVTFQATVQTESSFFKGLKTFTGKTTDGRSIKFVVKKDNGLKGTLTIDGLAAEKGFICKEQIFFEM